MSWCDLDLNFELAVVTLTYKSCLGYISETLRCSKLIQVWYGHWLGVVGVHHNGVVLIRPMT